MSKYDPLWDYIRQSGCDKLQLSFDEIAQIAGIPIDHAFLTFKKELNAYGYQVEKISMKNKTVQFARLPE